MQRCADRTVWLYYDTVNGARRLRGDHPLFDILQTKGKLVMRKEIIILLAIIAQIAAHGNQTAATG